MIKKCLIFIIVSILLIFTLSGCYDAKGLEDFYYIVALGIDESENDLIKLSIQIAKTSQVSESDSGSSQSNDYKIYTVDCSTIDSGISILNNYLNKTINLSHCSAIVFSEAIAKQGLKKYLNILENNTEIRPSCNIIISSTTAYDILDNISNSGERFSSRLYDYILTSVDYTGYTVDSSFITFFSRINNENSQASTVYAIVNDNVVQNSGAAVFKEDKMVGTISPLQSIMHLILTNNLGSSSFNIDNPFIENNKFDLNIRQLSNTRINIDIINNTPFITISLFLECIVDSSDQSFDYTSFKNVSLLESTIKDYISKEMKKYLYLISKEYDSDIANLGGILPSKYLTTDELEKVHWNDVFSDSYFDINTEITVTSSHLFNKE